MSQSKINKQVNGQNARQPTVSMIIPVYNGGMNFKSCLESLAELSPLPLEVIVVADGDGDGSRLLAEAYADKVIAIPESRGPAYARNLGAQYAGGDILFFMDSDVVPQPDAVGRITAAFQENPEPTALIGSYDDEPGAANFLSQYKNLFHHYVHQTGNEDASTFWGACGAIRKKDFFHLGGFDEGYRQPCIEDIELGYRLKEAGGKIRLLKDLRVKHLKRWTVKSLLEADIFLRALPWSRLILEKGPFINDLNLKTADRLSVLSVFLMAALLIPAGFYPPLLVLIPIPAAVVFGFNRHLYRFFKKKHGPGFLLKVIPWHFFYFFYSGFAFALSFILYHLRKAPLFHRLSVGPFKPMPDR